MKSQFIADLDLVSDSLLANRGVHAGYQLVRRLAMRARTFGFHLATLDLRQLPADFLANPYPVYAWLREHAPLKRLPDGSVFLTRHADLVAVYRDAQTFSSDKQVEFGPKYNHAPFNETPWAVAPGTSPLYQHHTSSLVFNDPPLHTRVRRIIMGALTPLTVKSTKSMIAMQRLQPEIKKLQAEWKAVGGVPRGHEKAVWERFRSACAALGSAPATERGRVMRPGSGGSFGGLFPPTVGVQEVAAMNQ